MGDAKTFIIGSSNIDFVMQTERLPRRGESTIASAFMQVFGGKGANQAVAAARAGAAAYFVTCVGDDPYAAKMVEGYRESGLRTDFVFAEKDIWSGTALIMVDANGDNYLTVAPGANSRLTPERIRSLKAELAGAAWILIQFEIPPQTIGEIITVAAELGVPVAWNFAPAREYDPAWLAGTSLLIANESEAEYLAGGSVTTPGEAKEAAREIQRKGASGVILTLGRAGSWVQNGDEGVHVPAYEVEAVDSTAAGDVYCGCLVTALAEGRPMADAVGFATAGAALSVQVFGAQPSAPWRREIDAFLARPPASRDT